MFFVYSIPPLCVPSFVIDLSEGKGKIRVSPNYIVEQSNEKTVFSNYKDELIEYINI